MLKITVDIHPGGSAMLRRTLATMTIANVSNLADVSDYQVSALESANPLTGLSARICGFEVTGHDRRQSVWTLLETALAQMESAEWAEL